MGILVINKRRVPWNGIETLTRGNAVTKITRRNGRIVSTHVTETVAGPMDCSRIDTYIFQGARPEQYPFFVDAVINVEEVMVNNYATNQLKAYSWNPIKDRPDATPSIAWLDRIVDMLIGWRKLNLSVLVHCRAGISRSSLITAAYLMKTCRITLDEALFRLRERRPSANPNVGFMALLRAYEGYLLTSNS